VGILDIDAHHGNGTQEIFYADPGIRYASLHVDPGAGWFPHFVGFAEETGTGAGTGATCNIPLAPGSGDAEWLGALARCIEWLLAGECEAVVVSLGVDAAVSDPESPLEVSESGYREAGRRISSVELPTAFVQEGGYDLRTIGALVAAVLDGFEEGGLSEG
jgi:acetoin utilization deacetylase AcuC-like enzyme